MFETLSHAFAAAVWSEFALLPKCFVFAVANPLKDLALFMLPNCLHGGIQQEKVHSLR